MKKLPSLKNLNPMKQGFALNTFRDASGKLYFKEPSGTIRRVDHPKRMLQEKKEA